MFTKLKNSFIYWYYQYILITGLYMMENWERHLFTSFLVGVAAMASYTTYLYLPGHLAMLSRYISYFIGSTDPYSHKPDVHADSIISTSY